LKSTHHKRNESDFFKPIENIEQGNQRKMKLAEINQEVVSPEEWLVARKDDNVWWRHHDQYDAKS
jgi:hypothetical protein